MVLKTMSPEKPVLTISEDDENENTYIMYWRNDPWLRKPDVCT